MPNFIKKITFAFFGLVLLKGSDALAFDSAVDRPFFIEGVDTFEICVSPSYIPRLTIDWIPPIICVSYGPCEDEVFVIVSTPPEFPGGQDSLRNFINYNLSRNVNERTGGRCLGIQGTVVVRFIIEKDGSVSNPSILRGIGYGSEEEAIRVVEMMPNWTPGKHHGRVVRTQFIWPIRFTLGM